ncbi:MAG: DsrE family protein [Nitrospirae bacterium]|nr:DsrE family protein [Nitrospirota bacterium]
MKLGIFVNTDKNLDAVEGITKAALAKGHEVILFNMDDGTKLVRTPVIAALSKTKGVTVSFCDHSAKHMGVASDGLPSEIVVGSQYNNAAMQHDADKVIVL